jgi:hypothetical protein
LSIASFIVRSINACKLVRRSEDPAVQREDAAAEVVDALCPLPKNAARAALAQREFDVRRRLQPREAVGVELADGHQHVDARVLRRQPAARRQGVVHRAADDLAHRPVGFEGLQRIAIAAADRADPPVVLAPPSGACSAPLSRGRPVRAPGYP